MEIYKDLSNPASQEFEKLLSSQLSKSILESLFWFFINFQLVNNVFKKETSDTAKFRCIFSNINPGPPIRSGKYGVNAHNFPMGYIFPAFCNGPAASFSKKASEDIFHVAKTHRNGSKKSYSCNYDKLEPSKVYQDLFWKTLCSQESSGKSQKIETSKF